MLVTGLGPVRVDRRGQGHGPLERAEPPLAEVPVLALLLLLGLALAADRQRVAVDGDLHVLGLDPGSDALTTNSFSVSETSSGSAA